VPPAQHRVARPDRLTESAQPQALGGDEDEKHDE